MKFIQFFTLLLLFLACKESPKRTQSNIQPKNTLIETEYPETISKIYEAHGGLAQWNKMKSISFTLPDPDGDETTIVDLKSRKSLVQMPHHIIGFDSKRVWLLNKDTIAYKNDPKFYYNLMFYFQAMPFVFADSGIHYETVEGLTVEGRLYPGIKISYDNGVGASSEDNYVLYYNPHTYQMEWLAYTVTYFSKEKSEKFNFIKYSNWQRVNGLLLPETIQWYNVENGVPTTERDTVNFTDVTISENEPNESIFIKPEMANFVE